MHIAGMNQLAVAVKESFEALTTDNHTEAEEKCAAAQNRYYIDSVEFSDRALELSMGKDTETGSGEKIDTEQRQKENPGANQQQKPVFTGAGLLNVFA